MIRYQPSPTPPSSAKINCIRSIAERMADDMREMAFAGENVSVQTLGQRGYPEEVVKRLAPKAVGIARRQSTRQTIEA